MGILLFLGTAAFLILILGSVLLNNADEDDWNDCWLDDDFNDPPKESDPIV